MSDLPYRLRQTFKAWGIRSLGDEAADEIEILRRNPCAKQAETIRAMREEGQKRMQRRALNEMVRISQEAGLPDGSET